MFDKFILAFDVNGLHFHSWFFISSIDVMSYNPFNVTFTTNKLMRPNYVDWKRNLDIALILEDLKWVTQDFAPSDPNEHSM